MRKVILVGTIVGMLVIALSISGYVFAQDQNPPPPEYPNRPYSGGSRGRHSMMGVYQGFRDTDQSGYLHDYMSTLLANALGLTPDELQAKHDTGETAWSIAESLGYSSEEFYTLMVDIRTEAINQALADGVIPQEQAEWMLDRMNQMPMYGLDTGYGPCHRYSSPQGDAYPMPGWRWNEQPSS